MFLRLSHQFNVFAFEQANGLVMAVPSLQVGGTEEGSASSTSGTSTQGILGNLAGSVATTSTSMVLNNFSGANVGSLAATSTVNSILPNPLQLLPSLGTASILPSTSLAASSMLASSSISSVSMLPSSSSLQSTATLLPTSIMSSASTAIPPVISPVQQKKLPALGNDITKVVQNTQLFKALQPDTSGNTLGLGSLNSDDGSVIIGCQSFKPMSSGYGVNKAQIVPVNAVIASNSLTSNGSTDVARFSTVMSVPSSTVLSSSSFPGVSRSAPLVLPSPVRISIASNQSCNDQLFKSSANSASIASSKPVTSSYASISSKNKRPSRSKKRKSMDDDMNVTSSGSHGSSSSGIVNNLQDLKSGSACKSILIPLSSPVNNIKSSPTPLSNGFSIAIQKPPMDSFSSNASVSPKNVPMRSMPTIIELSGAMCNGNVTSASNVINSTSGGAAVTTTASSSLPVVHVATNNNNTKPTIKQLYLSAASQEVSCNSCSVEKN